MTVMITGDNDKFVYHAKDGWNNKSAFVEGTP